MYMYMYVHMYMLLIGNRGSKLTCQHLQVLPTAAASQLLFATNAAPKQQVQLSTAAAQRQPYGCPKVLSHPPLHLFAP